MSKKGHDHVYQRHSAVYNEEVVQKSTSVYNTDTQEYTHVHSNPQATVHMVNLYYYYFNTCICIMC